MYFGRFYLDHEKDMLVTLYKEAARNGGEEETMHYVLSTPNHHGGNLLRNLAKLCSLPLETDENGLLEIRGPVPCYVDAYNKRVYIFRLGGRKVANIYPDGAIEMKASVPAISKTLMSQTKDYRLSIDKTLIKSFILSECKFRTDLHTHMNANLPPDILIALGISHQIRYPLYYIKKLGLKTTPSQQKKLDRRRKRSEKAYQDSTLTGKYLDRKIDDNTFLNFAEFILEDPETAAYNIPKIRASLSVMKDGQAVFTNLEKVYLYRYVFAKGVPSKDRIVLSGLGRIPDEDISRAVLQMEQDHRNPAYRGNTLFQDKLLWIARFYQSRGIRYAEISDTTLVKKDGAPEMLRQVHQVMPQIMEETGVMLRFLAGIRRIPLTIVKDNITPASYLTENLQVLRAVAGDPYVAGSDILGEEINDIRDIRPVIREIVSIAGTDPTFVVRVHAGENDSLRDNVANSISCVLESLEQGQKMPRMRIGHGLYTSNLRSPKGKHLIRMINEHEVVLEFQITSNVRLNNLSMVERHPLKDYLKAGIRCVQGTDGGALYGTDSIDEELALWNLLSLTYEEMLLMRRTEDSILAESEAAFREKRYAWRKRMEAYEAGLMEDPEAGFAEDSAAGLMEDPEACFAETTAAGLTKDLEAGFAETPDAGTGTSDGYVPTGRKTSKYSVRDYYEKMIEDSSIAFPIQMETPAGKESAAVFADRIEELPPGLLPVIIAGGSFNNDRHKTSVEEKGKRLIDRLLAENDPDRICFVIGHKAAGYEQYLLQQNLGKFRVFAFVPREITDAEAARLLQYPVKIRVAIEPSSVGLYKSIAYEIFKRRSSVLFALDGNSAAVNLIQEAKNAKKKCTIYINSRARMLAAKARSLRGYVTVLNTPGESGEDSPVHSF